MCICSCLLTMKRRKMKKRKKKQNVPYTSKLINKLKYSSSS